MKRQLTILIGMILAVFSIQAQGSLDKTFSDINKIEFSVGSGDAEFRKSGSNDVSVKMEHTYNTDYNPTVEKRGSTLVIKEERRNGNYRGSATWTLEIPDGLDIRFNTGSGDISIEDLEGDWSFNSGSGDFTLADVKGDLSINTGSGDVSASNIDGELSFNTGSGDVEVTGAVGSLSANTGSGNIRANAITLQGRSSFNTGSGNSVVSFAQSPDYDVSVNTGSGDATVEFRGNDMEGLLVMEANKRNGKIEAPFAFDSTEEIDNGGNNIRIRKTKKFSDKDVKIKSLPGPGLPKSENN